MAELTGIQFLKSYETFSGQARTTRIKGTNQAWTSRIKGEQVISQLYFKTIIMGEMAEKPKLVLVSQEG